MSHFRAFFARLVGMKGMTRRRIEGDTRTKLQIPPPNHSGDVVLTGQNARDVAIAASMVRQIVKESRNHAGITDFIAVPSVTQELKDNFVKFKVKRHCQIQVLFDRLQS